MQVIFKALGIDIYSLEGAWNSLVTFIQGTLLPAIQPIIDAALNVAAAFREQMPMVQQTVKDMADFVINQINILSPTLITNITNTLNSIAAFWREHGDEIMAVVKVAFEFITVTIGGAMTLASGLISAAWQLINGDTRGAGETLKTTVTAFMNSVLSIVGQDLDKFTANWTAVWELTKIIWNTFWSDFIGTWTANWELAKIIVTTVVDKIKAAFTDIDWFAVGVGIVNTEETEDHADQPIAIERPQDHAAALRHRQQHVYRNDLGFVPAPNGALELLDRRHILRRRQGTDSQRLVIHGPHPDECGAGTTPCPSAAGGGIPGSPASETAGDQTPAAACPARRCGRRRDSRSRTA